MVNPPSLYSAFPWNSAARFFRAVFGVLVLLAAAGTASAQVFICHVKPDSTDALTSAGGAAPYEDGAMQPTLRVAIHTLRNDAGVGGCSGADVDSLWVRAMEDFSAVGIQLLLHDKSDIKSNVFLTDPIGNAPAMFAAHADSNCINIFLGVTGGTVEGTTSGVPGLSLALTGATVGSFFRADCRMSGNVVYLQYWRPRG